MWEINFVNSYGKKNEKWGKKWKNQNTTKWSFPSSLFFLLISYKCSKLSNFRVDLFIEVESIFFPASDLKKIVIKSFFSDSNFRRSLLKGSLDVVAILIMESGIKLSPESYFLNDLSDFFLFLFVVLIIFDFIVLNLLFLK